MPHKFKIVSRKDDQFGVQFLYNSEIMVWSESYKAKSSAKNCIDSIKRNAPGAPIVDLTKDESGSGYRFEIAGSKNGEFFTRFVASNGETMVRSETYTDKRNAINCAESIAKNAPDAPVEDES
ncbi:YegP family protein [Chelativorans intermedius]|uniref:YegP family protein n=1 Tax=Chelativorans intermedius TaxID=515947 RepID=A0ABV6DAK4_9HYPH|nr:YegP family protein [Chelativorans intermedius]